MLSDQQFQQCSKDKFTCEIVVSKAKKRKKFKEICKLTEGDTMLFTAESINKYKNHKEGEIRMICCEECIFKKDKIFLTQL